MKILLRIIQIVGFCCIFGYIFYLFRGESKGLLLIIPICINLLVLHLKPERDKNRNSYRYLTAYEKSKKYLASPIPVKEFMNQTKMTLTEIEFQIGKGTISAYEYDEFLFIDNNERNN